MKRYLLILLTISLSLVSSVFGHLCHDPYRPKEHLILIPEERLIRIEEEGSFRIYVENTFHSRLEDVRLNVVSQAFDIEIEPQVLKRLSPGERTFFLVKLRLREGFEPGDYPLRIDVTARNAELTPDVERVDIIVEGKRVEEEVLPCIKEPEPTLQKEEIEEEKPILPERAKRVREVILPKEGVKEITPSEEVEVLPPVEEVIPPTFPEDKGEEVVVKVEERPFWKNPYLYLGLILLLLGIVIWRRLR